MNNVAKLAIGVAAVAVAAFVGINMLPARDGVGAGPTASPSPAASPSPMPSPSPAAVVPAGPLAVGTYPVIYDGVPMSFKIPTSGWTAEAPGNSIGKGEYPQPDWAGIDFWLNAPDNVYADPCAHTALDPKPNGTAADLAAAVAAIPGTELVSGPSAIEVGGRPAQYVELTIKEDLACDPHSAYLWYDESSGGATGGWRWAEGLGAAYRIWITEVDGKLVWIDAYTFPGAKPELDQEILQIIDSIKFE